MQNFSGLRIAPIVHLAGLISREDAQRVFRKFGVQRESLVGGDDGIAPEHCGEPGNSRSDDVLIANRYAQRVKVSHGVAKQVVEYGIRAGKTCGSRIKLMECGAARLQLGIVFVERRAAFLVLHAGSYRNLQPEFSPEAPDKVPNARCHL